MKIWRKWNENMKENENKEIIMKENMKRKENKINK